MPSINPDRFRNDFDALAQIGSTGDGGVNRPALSEAHLEARRWWIARAAEAGLETRIDGAGNHSAILRSPDPDARTLLLGSHTDSVPSGGRFDGALGVIAALEALRTIQDAGITLPVHLEAIDFTDEEGALVGLTGSGALAEQLTVRSFENPRSGRTRWEASLARAGLTEAGILSARRDPKSLAGYLELHIEQGPRLFATGVDIGVVSGIVGIQSYRVTYRGEANHAGTTPMETRRDASLGASAFVLTARDLVMKNFPGCVVNVGQMALRPGAFNIVPGVAELSLEFRAPEPERLAQLGTALLQLAELVASQYGLTLTAEPAGMCVPAPMSTRAQQAIIAAAESLGLSHATMPSGAGHDAMMLAPLTDVGMIFVPSRGGISHSPLEITEWRDCVNGANVLLRAALNMAIGQ
ncbi:MAG TPA: Zn-dependent hydrolase [Anaerolineae bacterium]|nr:Zn-dependent hydrolase [Anaerolineae bacterium]